MAGSTAMPPGRCERTVQLESVSFCTSRVKRNSDLSTIRIFPTDVHPCRLTDNAHKYRDATEPQGEYLLRNRSNCSLESSFNPYRFIMPRRMAKSPQLTTSGRHSEKINSIWAVQTPMPGRDDNFSIIPSSGIFLNSRFQLARTEIAAFDLSFMTIVTCNCRIYWVKIQVE